MGSRPSVDIILKPCVILSDNSTRALRLSATQAIFHEGSKGYLCCKRRVLEFAEFLKIEGCTTGTHLFVGSKKDKVDLRFRPGKFKLMLARLRRKLCLVGWTIIRHRCRCMSRHSRKGERELYALSRAPLNPRRADKERSKVVFEPQQVRSGRPLKINPVLRRIDYHCAPLLTLAASARPLPPRQQARHHVRDPLRPHRSIDLHFPHPFHKGKTIFYRY